MSEDERHTEASAFWALVEPREESAPSTTTAAKRVWDIPGFVGGLFEQWLETDRDDAVQKLVISKHAFEEGVKVVHRKSDPDRYARLARRVCNMVCPS